MYRSISFSTICGLALICLSTTVPSAKADDAVPPVAVKETKFLLEDAKQHEKDMCRDAVEDGCIVFR